MLVRSAVPGMPVIACWTWLVAVRSTVSSAAVTWTDSDDDVPPPRPALMVTLPTPVCFAAPARTAASTVSTLAFGSALTL